MGRFGWLEFDKDRKEGLIKEQPDELRVGEKEGIDYHLSKGRKAFEKGDYDIAIRYYSQALNLDNYNKEGWKGEILCLICLGKYDDVLIWVEHAKGFVSDTFFEAAKAFALNRLGLHNEALQVNDVALSNPEADWFCWITRGDIILGLDNLADAEFCFYKAIEFCRDDWFPYMFIGICFISAKKYEKAIDYFLKSLKNKNDNPIVYLHLAYAHDKLKNISQAIFYAKLALEYKPNLCEALLLLKRLRKKKVLYDYFPSIMKFLRI